VNIYLDLWAGNKVVSNDLMPYINGVWFKLVDGDNPKDFLFDKQFSESLGHYPRGIYAFPKSEWSPIQNYDRIMMLYPEQDGELRFMLDMEKKNSKSPQQQNDELQELLIRLDITLGRYSIIYTNLYWWKDNIAPAMPDWTWKYDFVASQYRYNGGRITKKLSELESWLTSLVGNTWADMPAYTFGKPTYWQITGDRLRIPEVKGDIDVIITQGDESMTDKIVLYYPVDEGMFTISQKFGENPQYYPGSKGHNGIDWAVPVGNKIYCAMDGEVIVSEDRKEKTGYGRQIRIKCANGITLIYGHLSRRDVQLGDIVKAKEVIGLSGGATSDPYSGYSTGPHLHFEARLDKGAPQVPGGYSYGAIDTLPYLVSHKYGGEEAKPLYRVKVLIYNLAVRSGPGVHYAGLRNSGKGEFDIYEERTVNDKKFGRISTLLSEWIFIGNPEYVTVVTPPVPQDPIEFSEWVVKLDAWAREQGFDCPPLKLPIKFE